MSKHRSDDEYQFPSEEYTTISQSDTAHDAEDVAAEDSVTAEENEQPASPQKPGLLQRFPFLTNKRIMVPAGLIILVSLGLYFFNDHKTTRVVASSTSTQPVTQPTAPVSKPTTETPNNSAAMMASEMNSQLTGLMETVHNNQAQIDELRQRVMELTTVLQQHNQSNGNDSQMLGQVARQLESIQGQLSVLHVHQAALEQHFKPKAHPKVAAVKPKPIVYHIEAIEPGRAWLQDQHHHSQTVRVGNKLPQYGIVIGIDSDQGVVLTSSGKVIHYGANDS